MKNHKKNENFHSTNLNELLDNNGGLAALSPEHVPDGRLDLLCRPDDPGPFRLRLRLLLLLRLGRTVEGVAGDDDDGRVRGRLLVRGVEL